MRVSRLAVIVGLLAQSAPSQGGDTDAPRAVATPSPTELARRELARVVQPSIVSITNYEKVPDGASYEGRWLIAEESPIPGYARQTVASGIVVDSTGTVLCCRSPLLLENGSFADHYDVESSSGTRFSAELLGAEPTINLAVLRVKPAEGQSIADLVPIRVGAVAELQVGDDLFAMGDPFGSARTFAPGVVMSLPQASCYQADLTGSLIHASMSVCPGASGGALVDRNGSMMAMIVPPPAEDPATRTAPEPFVTYGMQAQTALAVGEALTRKRTTTSPFLGFSVLNLAELKAKLRDDRQYEAIVKPAHGLYIDDIFTPSPAAAAGVQVGDFVMEINGNRISTVPDFQQALYYFAGTTVPVRIFRAGRELTPMIAIESRPVEANRR